MKVVSLRDVYALVWLITGATVDHRYPKRNAVFDDLLDVLNSVAQLPSKRPQIGELRLVLRGVLIGLLSDRDEYSHMGIDTVQAA